VSAGWRSVTLAPGISQTDNQVSEASYPLSSAIKASANIVMVLLQAPSNSSEVWWGAYSLTMKLWPHGDTRDFLITSIQLILTA